MWEDKRTSFVHSSLRFHFHYLTRCSVSCELHTNTATNYSYTRVLFNVAGFYAYETIEFISYQYNIRPQPVPRNCTLSASAIKNIDCDPSIPSIITIIHHSGRAISKWVKIIRQTVALTGAHLLTLSIETFYPWMSHYVPPSTSSSSRWKV